MEEKNTLEIYKEYLGLANYENLHRDFDEIMKAQEEYIKREIPTEVKLSLWPSFIMGALTLMNPESRFNKDFVPSKGCEGNCEGGCECHAAETSPLENATLVEPDETLQASAPVQ